MPKILIVDDSEMNREYLVTLLSHFGHVLSESEDGVQGLQTARQEHPDLIIADILMPSMDGYEFVRQLRLDESIATIPVVFCSAHFHEHEAKRLAQACGVSHILPKPSEPEEILQVVDRVLGIAPAVAEEVGIGFDFDREHVRLLTDKLTENTHWLRSTNEKLSAMIELGIQLGSERDPLRLLTSFCNSVRDILSARTVIVGIMDEVQSGFRYYLENGVEKSLSNGAASLRPDSGLFHEVLRACRSCRGHFGDPQTPLPEYLPDGRTFLVNPVVSLSRVYGWVCMIDKLPGPDFTEEDERIGTILAAQVGRVYENGRLYVGLLTKVEELNVEIAERRRAEAELERFFTQSQNLLCVLDAEGILRRINPAWPMTLGFREDELLDRSILEFVHPADRSQFQSSLASLGTIDEPTSIESRCRCEDGTFKWFQWTVMPFSDHGGIFATGHDFTNRRMAEDALRESEERFRQIAESIREVIWLTDLGSDEILYVSPAYELTWGRTRESLYRAPKSWLAAVHPEDLPLATGGLASAAAGIPSEAAYRLVRPDGSTRAVQDHRFPIRDVSGRVFRIAGVVEDVTDRRNLEEQLRQSQKMEAIGVLAGGVAHDFNNLLTVINGYAEFLIERLREQEQEREFAKHILHAGEHAASLTQQLLAFSRKQILLPEVIDLNQILTDTKKLLDRIIGEDIRLEIVMEPDLWSTKVDKGQFEQVLMNLVVNARDAMPQGGGLHIETANVWIDEASVSLDVGIAVGEYVRLTVADTGIGMDAATKARIFEPFFTTKGPQKGTGLGLSTVFGIISQSRGYIDIHSEPGVGTTFSVYLPRELPSVNPERVQRPSRAPHGKETILVAEDDETVRTFTKQVLTHYGYRVLIANDGLQAVVVAESYPGEIHLLLTDVVMPNLGGQKLVEKVRSFRPELKVLYMSGYTDETVLQHLDRSAQTMFIHKPFSPDTLAGKVREVLESSSI